MNDLDIDTSWEESPQDLDEILQKAIDLRAEFSGEPEKYRPKALDASQLTPSVIAQINDAADVFVPLLHKIQRQSGGTEWPQDHPWRGVNNIALSEVEVGYLAGALSAWQKAIVDMGRVVFGYAKANAAPEIARLDLARLSQLADELEDLPSLTGVEVWDFLKMLSGERLQQARQCLDVLQRLHQQEDILAEWIKPWQMLDLDTVHRHVKAGMVLNQTLQPVAPLHKVHELLDCIEQISPQLKQLEGVFAKLDMSLQGEGENGFFRSFEGVRDVVRMLELVAELPGAYWSQLHCAFAEDEFDAALAELKTELDSLQPLHEQLDVVFGLSQLPPLEETRRCAELLGKGGKTAWLDRNKRAARDSLKKLALLPSTPMADLVAKIPALIEYQQRLEALKQRQDLAQALGPIYQGADTDITAASKIRAWYCRLDAEFGADLGLGTARRDAILRFPSSLARSLRQLYVQQGPQLNDALLNLAVIRTIVSEHHPLRGEHCDLLDEKNGLLAFAAAVKQALAPLAHFVDEDKLTVRRLHERIETHRRLNRDYANWQRFRAEQRLFQGLELDLKSAGTVNELPRAKTTLAMAESLHQVSIPQLVQVILRKAHPDDYRRLLALGQSLPKLVKAEREQRAAFIELAQLDLSVWLAHGDSIKAIFERNKRALAAEDDLPDWLAYLQADQALRQYGLDTWLQDLELGELPIELAKTALNAGIYDALSAAVLDHDLGG